MKTSEKISLRRRILNITQEDLSKKIGVSSKTIGRWESSERSPSGDVLIKLASALDTTVSYLLGETDTPTESNAHEITDIIWVPVVSDRVKVCAGNGNAYPGITVRYAMQLTALTFVRSAELRHVEWEEVDLEKAEWRIPAEKMKMKRTHIVPLSTQAIAIFEKLKLITGHEKYVFMSLRSSDGTRPLSDAAILVALRRIGYSKDEMTTHGFRTMASTLLNELGWNRDAIERQLAHSDRDAVRAAYNYADYLIERRKMMQAWADYLDELRAAQ